MKKFFIGLLAAGVLLFSKIGTACAAAVVYETPAIEGIGLVPYLEVAVLPNASESTGEFSSDIYECYVFEGDYYYVFGRSFREKDQPWEAAEAMILAESGTDELAFHSYEELRALAPVGVYGEDGKIRWVLYKIGDGLLLEADYAFHYSALTGRITYTVPPERIKYTLCARVPRESIPKNSWIEWRGNPRYAYAGADGRMVTGNRVIDGVRYVFNEYGYCQGAYTGFTTSKKGRRYWRDGVLVKNKWIRVGGERKYYAGSDGYFVTGTRVIGGTEYTFAENGAAAYRKGEEKKP